MAFHKQVAMLKQQVDGFSIDGKSFSAIVRIETDKNKTELFVSVIGLCSSEDGEYYVNIIDKSSNFFEFSLGKNPLSCKFTFNEKLSLENGFCATITFLHKEPIVIAFGKTADFNGNFNQIKRIVTANYLTVTNKSERAIENKEEPTKKTESANDEKINELFQKPYNDDVVASENYFLKEDVNVETLTVDNEENAPPTIKELGENLLDENSTFFNEKLLSAYEKISADIPYYKKVETELENLFRDYPEEENLQKVVPFSKWIKIEYAKNKFYAVGIIYDNGEPLYVCYGVPAKYSASPPKNFSEYCSFIPLSVFDLCGDGYWVLYQNATTGKCIKTETFQ